MLIEESEKNICRFWVNLFSVVREEMLLHSKIISVATFLLVLGNGCGY